MMPENAPLTTSSESNLQRRLGWLCLGLAIIAASLAGVHTIVAEDLGYHLAFGETFWQEGRLVDHCEFIYTLPPASQTPKPDPGPGCWYDAQGRYRFPNANWLTQVIFYGVWWLGGVGGLNVLLAVCVAGLMVLLAGTCLRAGGSPITAAIAVLLAVLTIFPRLMLRPELLGYVPLLATAMLLAPLLTSGGSQKRLSRKAMVGIVLLQLLYVNLHSYWMLGLAMTGATLLGPLIHALRDPRDAETRDACLRAMRQRGGLLLAQTLVCFVNPWTWRLVALPVQTLIYLRAHDIRGVFMTLNDHPWNSLADMQKRRLIPTDPATDLAGCFFAVVFVLMVLAVLVALFRKRWSIVVTLMGMLLVAFSAERNLAVAVLIALPLAAAVLDGTLREAVAQRLGRLRVWLGGAAMLMVLGGATVAGLCFVRNTLYERDLYRMRFGSGLDREVIPVGVAELLNPLQPTGRLWASPQTSSGLYFWLRPHPEIQMITNTWAYPPAAMKAIQLTHVFGSAHQLATMWEVSIAAVQPGDMFLSLRTDANWTLLGLADGHAVFVRNDGPDARLADAGVNRSSDAWQTANEWEFRDRLLRARQLTAFNDARALADYQRLEALLADMNLPPGWAGLLTREKQAAEAKIRHGGSSENQ